MSETDLTVTYAGRELPVQVGGDGQFYVMIDGERIGAPSYELLKRAVNKIKVRFELPFTRLTGYDVRNGTVTGIHAVNGNLLVRWSNGDTEQVSSYGGGGEFMPQLAIGELDQLSHLVSERTRISREIEKFVKPRKWGSLKQAAKDAQETAVKEAENAES